MMYRRLKMGFPVVGKYFSGYKEGSAAGASWPKTGLEKGGLCS